MLKRLLIANRGEIACRVIRSCRRLGVHTIAVFSDADRQALHVQLADEAHYIGGAAPNESYLNTEKLLAAAKLSGADSIHPGYGFLSENADFVRLCQKENLIFVGPSAATMDQMGSKADAKAAMQGANVPTVPGYHGAEQDAAVLAKEANSTGYPLMIKAAAGGGGKGMRIVRNADEFQAALESAQREAANAFGDTRVILERYLENPRHIEVQVFGDSHGNVVHLFERDCSSQRRYQKVIEEAPSPFLPEQQREAMYAAAVAAAKAVDYVNAGTIEFIVDEQGEFFFMEMNTRLQVEHPVTEMTTGEDLVEWQLRVAAGEPLPKTQDQLQQRGHAIEARIYAEDADNGFLPSAGRIDWLAFPDVSNSQDQVRIDSGVYEGGEVTVHYDPMIAKLVVAANDRSQALAALREALTKTAIGGLHSNVDFLLALCSSEIFQRGEIHTAYLDHHLNEIIGEREPPPADALLVAVVAHLMNQEWDRVVTQIESQDPHSPWAIADGWRLGHYGRRIVSFVFRGEHYEITATGFHGNYAIQIGDDSFEVSSAELGDSELSMLVGGQRRRATVIHREPRFQVVHDGRLYQFTAEDPFAVELSDAAAADRIVAPMPGKIVAVKASVGDAVSEGQELIIMEAMKMELSLPAPRDGVIESIPATADAFVEADTPLLQLATDAN